ncbi:cell envelope integrity protein TolA [Klebsiella pneumoniae]|uniref:cell envelope integrity protein TolA n=1 Tax=Klebsiella pneumoniae TaxID=573 RepID=UPI00285226AD|nr:cell envelope integrity protein TolA [Klebsiella pneumoniae]MDR4559634.1 cell envelope integrity protein TolA [Klebsiella pneumoniae]MDR4797885.1 cell envelope integrity protein TolA [Klebsiella pneumoniae]MDR4813633.1 cell envelope integrity protein TolA [Klebsiella pneumoniae]
MSGTQITASTLVNKIVYRTDLNSLKKVRNDMRKLQKDFSKTEGTIAKAKMQAQKQAYTAQMQQQRQVQQQQKQAAKQAAVDAKAKANEQKKLAAAQARALKIQQQQTKKVATQQENADLARKRAAFQLGRLQNMSGADRYAAIKQANALVDAYARGNTSLKSMNQALSQHLTTQRIIARNNAKQAKQSGKAKKSGSSGWLSRQASAFIPGEILGPTAAAYAAQQAYQIMAGTLAGAIERNQGRKMISSMGLNPLEADAAIQETLKRTGFNMSYEKISDISKDVQDKIGQLSLGEWKTDKKTGQSTYSGGGEMGDWLQMMVSRGGYTQQGALKTLQNVKGPVELAVLLEGLRKSAKLTDSEFTALAEAINDFSYLAKSVDASGKNVIDTMNMMINSGLALNSQQQKSIDNLSQMSIVFDNARNALGDQFAASFSKGLEDLGINTQNLSSEMGSLVPLVKDLGTGTTQTVKGFKDLLDVLSIITEWKNRLLGTDKPEGQNIFQQGATFVGESLLPPGVLDMASRIKNIVSPGSDSSVASQVQSGGWYNQMMVQTPAMQYQPVIPDLKADFNLTVNPSPEFGMMVEAVADKRIEWAFDDTNFQINQSILGE